MAVAVIAFVGIPVAVLLVGWGRLVGGVYCGGIVLEVYLVFDIVAFMGDECGVVDCVVVLFNLVGVYGVPLFLSICQEFGRF